MIGRMGIIAAAILGAAAFQQAPPIGPPPAQTRPIGPQVTPATPIDPGEAARRIQSLSGPWTVRCRPGGEMTMSIDDLSAETSFIIEVQAAWKLELMAVRAPRGFNQRPLEPGECALADAPPPGSGRYLRLVRLLEARGTAYAREPRLALRRMDVTPQRTEVNVQSPDAIFNAVVWRAAVGPDGTPMVDTYLRSGGLPRYAPFDVRLTRCDLRCARGRGATDNVFYISAHIQEPR